MKAPSSAAGSPAPFPLLTALLAVAALVAWTIPGVNEALQFDRTALARGEWWRLFTGHLTHWTADHLGWDLAAFVLLGVLVERRSRGLLIGALASSTVAISGAVWLAHPELATYRGLSGLDSALLGAVAAGGILGAVRERRWSAAAWPALAALGFVAKTMAETFLATTLFVTPGGSFVPVSLAHIAGAVAGLVAALAYSSSANAAHVVAACPCGSPTGRLRSM